MEGYERDKKVNTGEVGLENDVCPIQSLTISLGGMNVTALAFWLSNDEVWGSIGGSVFVKEECPVFDGNVNCVVKRVFNHCTITFNY